MELDFETWLSEDYGDVEPSMGPHPAQADLHHVLVVADHWSEAKEDDADVMWIEHDARCPTVRVTSADGKHTHLEWDCNVARDVDNAGILSFFVHWDSLELEDRVRWQDLDMSWHSVEIPVRPGHYAVEHWFYESRSYYGDYDWESGFNILAELA